MTNSNQPGGDEQDMVVSFLTIRKAVGVSGIALPIVLLLGTWLVGSCPNIKSSVSAYYYTIMGNYLTGTLCAVGLFLFTYRGSHRDEQILTNVAAVFAIITALFPTNSSNLTNDCNFISKPDDPISNTVHYLAAAIFLVLLAYISLRIFPRLDPGRSFTQDKIRRNKIYKTCGWIMLISLFFIPFLLIHKVIDTIGQYKPEVWLETIALWSFGFSWLVKGRTFEK